MHLAIVNIYIEILKIISMSLTDFIISLAYFAYIIMPLLSNNQLCLCDIENVYQPTD